MDATNLQPDKDFEWAVGINRWGLKVCGIWRGENYSYWHNAFSNLVAPMYVIILIVIVIFPQSLALLKVWGNLALMTENLITSVPITMTIGVITTTWCKKEVIMKIMHLIKDDWSRLKSEQEREVMMEYAHTSRMITLGAYTVIATTVLAHHPPLLFGINLRTVTNITDPDDRVLVLPCIYLFDVYRTPIYELTVLSHMVTCFLAGFLYSTIGCLFGAMILHVCSQLKNLTIKLEQMLQNDRKEEEEEENDFQHLFSSNVKEHQRLIRFVEMVENAFSIMLLIIVPSFTITLCIQGFQLIRTVSDGVDRPLVQVLYCIVYMGFIGLVMFVYSSVGEVLAAQSEEIQYAAYNCKWYNLRPKEAAQLIIILIRAQRPLQITAGKFVPLTLTTFATLLKTTAGYISCLLAVQEL